jgi:thiazole/oxazole-forming peptide maturase SagD family component
MKNKFFPIFTMPCIVLEQKTTFYGIDRDIVVQVPGKLMRQLVNVCNGKQSMQDIVQLLKNEWNVPSVHSLVWVLRKSGVLVDSHYISDAVWALTKNSNQFQPFFSINIAHRLVEEAKRRHRVPENKNSYCISLTPFQKLLNQRHSTRSFSGCPVETQKIIDILWSAYGEICVYENGTIVKENMRRTVPSAGALYPLTVYIILFQDNNNLSAGIYRVCMGSAEQVKLDLVSKDVNKVLRSFMDPLLFGGAHGVVVIAGSFRITSQKYGNRSMLYVPLEAGYVAQNLHLAALDVGLGTLEIGGFYDELLAESIQLPQHYYPLTTIAFGYEKDANENVVCKTSNQGIEVQWTTPMVNQYKLPFTIVSTRIKSLKGDWSSGRDVSPALAYTKAVAEAKEWSACGCIPDILVSGKLSDFKDVVDPREIIRFHPSQYHLKRFPFKPFSDKQTYTWVNGKDELHSSKKYILADLVYFPYYPKNSIYSYANSSGVAAYPNLQGAIEKSVLELIERDSFMIAYLAKLSFPNISFGTLPEKIQKRIEKLQKVGFRIWIRDFSIDLSPVIFIFAQNESLYYSTCSACSSFDVEYAVDHALMEVEASILMRLQSGLPIFLKPIDVAMPLDHGRVYEQKRFYRKADFLVFGRSTISFQRAGKNVSKSWQELLDILVKNGFSLITVPLYLSEKLGGNDELHIVRSIIPGLVPMTFGYRQEPGGINRIYAVAAKVTGKSISYRDLSKFPHPFA